MLAPTAFLRYLSGEPKYLGATSIEEQAWCRWFAAEAYTADGVIVELGPWLGSLTASYCEGLRANPRAAARGKTAYVYDLFEWSAIFEEWARGTNHAGRFRPGDSFEDYFRALRHDDERFLTILRADLATAPWLGPPIELLINDAVKSLAVADNVFRTFVPALIPGRSYVMHQDFLWSTDAYIQVFMFLARDSFVYEHAVPRSTAALFRNVRRFDPAVLHGYTAGGTLDQALIAETFAWSRRTLTDVSPTLLRLCEAVVLRDFGYGDRGREIVAAHGLDRPQGDGVYDQQLETLRAWGYSDLVPEH